MNLVETLRTLRDACRDADVVITTMGSAREWMRLGSRPLDFIYAPSAMGQAPTLGLGVALAQPHRRVVVCNGDGCLLMNLGCLVTIVAAAPPNLFLLNFDNGVYEVTGGQQTAAGSARSSGAPVDYGAMAVAAGFRHVHAFDSAAAWTRDVSRVLTEPGPVFVTLKVDPVPGGEVPKSPAPPPDRARQFAERLQSR